MQLNRVIREQLVHLTMRNTKKREHKDLPVLEKFRLQQGVNSKHSSCSKIPLCR